MEQPAGEHVKCALPDGSTTPVDVFDGMSVRDLRDVLFSLTDVPPERISLRVVATGQLLRPPGVGDSSNTESALLADVGIHPKSTVEVLDTATTPPGPTTGALTLNDLSAALSAVGFGASAASAASISSQPSHPPPPRAAVEYIRRLKSYHDAVLEYERPALQALAREAMPESELRASAARAVADKEAACSDAELTRSLLAWFKRDFFTWVNALPCWSCGEKNTQVVGMATPSESDLRYGARRVEVHECPSCKSLQRFPRYNAPARLLETRRGRCGEWAQVFTLMCRALGLHARAVHDETDHVWTEVWSTRERRWLHADACEDALDTPLMYEEGWGKKLSYCVATGVGCVVDVTRRYTNRYDDVKTRRDIADEHWLATQLAKLHVEAVAAVPTSHRAECVLRNDLDARSLTTPTPSSSAQEQQPRGRQSGSEEWVRSRGEDGAS